MTMSFVNKTVLISGASRGLGAATALAFAQHGATVIINYKSNHTAAQQTVERCEAAGGQAWAIAADVQSEQDVNTMCRDIIDETGHIDILVNNAFAPYRFNPDTRPRFMDLKWEQCETQFHGAIKSTWLLSQACLPSMQKKGVGSIINIGSDLSEEAIVPYVDYATAKAALQGLTRQMAADLGPFGIRVNCIAPGLIWPTDSSRDTRATHRDRIIAQTPLRRIANVDDVTGPILFLASEHSRFMTGQTLIVDGGLVMR